MFSQFLALKVVCTNNSKICANDDFPVKDDLSKYPMWFDNLSPTF
jgi:hypothetical protein